jgi:hypothetical protein
MHHFIAETLPLFGFGILGICIMALVKMNDINNMNDNYTFKIVTAKFLSREWPSYALSILIVLVTCLTHDEWLSAFADGGPLAKIAEVPIGVKLAMVLWGIAGQYFLYKLLGKMKTPAAAIALDAKQQQETKDK